MKRVKGTLAVALCVAGVAGAGLGAGRHGECRVAGDAG